MLKDAHRLCTVPNPPKRTLSKTITSTRGTLLKKPRTGFREFSKTQTENLFRALHIWIFVRESRDLNKLAYVRKQRYSNPTAWAKYRVQQEALAKTNATSPVELDLSATKA